MWKSVLCLSVTAALASCAAKPQLTLPIAATPLVTYSPEFQKQAAKELPAVKAIAPNVATMIVDYGKLRNAVRAAQ